jgi:hypothetical protein
MSVSWQARRKPVVGIVLLLLWGLARPVGAQSPPGMATSSPTTLAPATEAGWAEVIVNGPSGALLAVDGQAVGSLPLLDSLRLSPGPHRFRLERGGQRAESDILTLPASRQAELNLTLAGRSLVAVLSITPGALLLLAPSLRGEISTLRPAAVRAAKAEHVVVLSEARQAALLKERPDLLRCIDGGDCQQTLARTGEVAYVLRVLTTAEELQLQLFDLRTCDVAAALAARCMACTATQRGERLAPLVKRALQQLGMRGRGQLSVSSTPRDALLTLDGRILGRTPLTLEAFVGSHQLALSLPGHAEHRSEVVIEPGQTTSLEPRLSRPTAGSSGTSSSAERAATRPLWRFLAGGGLVGGGALLLGFGAAALAKNGSCLDAQADPATCSPYYNTLGIGAGLTAGGVALLLGGTVLMAWPAAKR